jgi:ligand-binding sensor domain-containing protein
MMEMNFTFSQPQIDKMEKLGIVDGLSSPTVTEVLEDNRGFLWIGTVNGLNRFDGTEIVTFYNQPNKNSVAGNCIYNLTNFDSTHIMIGTDQGISILNTQTYQFSTANLISSLKESKLGKKIFFIEKDKYDQFWVATDINLYYLDKALNLIRVYKSGYNENDIGKKMIKYITGVFPLVNGETIIKIRDGYYVANPTKESLEPLVQHYSQLLSYENVFNNCILHILDGKTLVFKSLIDNHVYFFNTITLDFNKTRFEWKLSSTISKISHWVDDWYFCSLNGGGMVWTKIANNKIEFCSKQTYPNYSFGKTIKDSYGNRWITSNWEDGLYKIPKYLMDFHILNLEDVTTQLSTNRRMVGSFLKKDQTMYITSYGNGFYKWNLNTDEISQKSIKINKYNENLVWNIRLYKDDTLWIGTQEGIVWYDVSSDKMGRIRLPHPKVIDEHPITFQYLDSYGIIWIGLGRSKGLCTFNMSTKLFRYLSPDITQSKSCNITNAIEDKNGNVWFVNEVSPELIYYDRKQDSFSINVRPEFKGIMNEGGVAITLSKDRNTIWYAVNPIGLVKFDINLNSVKTYKREFNQSFKYIESIVENDDYSLWLATNEGIVLFDVEKEKFKQFGISDGLDETNFLSQMYLDSFNNRIYIGSIGKVIYFHNQVPKSLSFKSNTLIMNLEINNRPFAIPSSKNIILKPNENNLSISFTSPNLNNGKENRYAYSIINSDTSWTDIGKQRLIQFASLQPGKYTFRVRAKGKDGEWATNFDYLNFTIKSPFYQTLWFYLLVLMCAGGIIYSWYRYRLNQFLKLERIRMEISSDLHDEIGSKLTSMGYMTLVAQKNNENNTELKDILEKIRDNSLKASASLRDIIWSVNPNLDILYKLMPKLIQHAAESFELKDINFKCTVDNIPQNLRLSQKERRDFELIFKECITNILKHSEAKTVNLVVSYKNRDLVLHLIDDGIGCDLITMKSGNGLKNMKMRAHHHNWKIDFVSLPNGGFHSRLQMRIT